MMLVPRRAYGRGLLPVWKRPTIDDLLDPDFFSDTTDKLVDFPRINIDTTDKEIVVTADVPGMDPKDINVDVDSETFTISGKREEIKEEKDSKRVYQERSFGQFMRSFTLPTRVDSEKVSAKFKNGTLVVTMPKLSSTQGRKVKVEIEK